MIRIRKGQAPDPLPRAEFSVRFRNAYFDPAFRGEEAPIARQEEIAWQISLDRGTAMQEETRNVARAVAKAVVELRAGRLQAVQPVLSRPRPK